MRIPGWLRPFTDFLKELIKEFNEDDSSLMAAAVSFYIFLSLIPLLLFAAALLSYALGSPEQAYKTVIDYLNKYSPSLAHEGSKEIKAIIEGYIHGRSFATGFGIAALLWAGSQAFINLSRVINRAWDTRPRGFFMRRIVGIALIFAVGILLLISFGITTAANAIQSYNITILGHNVSVWFGKAWTLIAFLLPLIVTIATFTLLYKVMPNIHVPIKSALAGAAVAGVLWEAAKYLFSWYVTHFSNYSAIYGSLASIVLLLLWIYYSSVVTILGAQISAIYYQRNKN